jgi:ribosomal protein L9
MKLYLLENVNKLGKARQVVEVKSGYGRHLISTQKALDYTNDYSKIKAIEDKYIEEENDYLQLCNHLKEEFDGTTVVVTSSLTPRGTLQHTVSKKAISEQLRKLAQGNVGIETIIDKLEVPTIKCVGHYVLTSKIHSQVTVSILVDVIA